jgi:ATP-dependent DNA helicase RecQ
MVAVLEYLDEQGLVALQPAELRQRYVLLAVTESAPELVDDLLERFARRERAETARIENVLALVTHDDCQVCALVGYFGEMRPEAADRDKRQRRRHRGACATTTPTRSARRDKQTRFVCGIMSPATSRARLTKDRLFRSLADRRFSDVIAWCERNLTV